MKDGITVPFSADSFVLRQLLEFLFEHLSDFLDLSTVRGYDADVLGPQFHRDLIGYSKICGELSMEELYDARVVHNLLVKDHKSLHSFNTRNKTR